MSVNFELLNQIDALELSDKNKAWYAAMKSAEWQIFADREKWTVKSWRETEGEDLEIRRAKLLASVLDNIEIKIHDFDVIVARPTLGVIGCATAIDCCGDYIPDIWNDDGSIEATMDASALVDPESIKILRESASLFKNQTYPGACTKAWEAMLGSWAADAESAKLKDPGIDSGITAQSTSTLNWVKLIKVGLRGYINEAKEHIEAYRLSGGTDVNKIYFWQSSIIVLEAVIRHAHRYSELARSMAAKATTQEEADNFNEIADICLKIPENKPETFREALQAMQFCNLAKMLENPSQNNCHWGRADQYLYPLFIKDLESGVPLEELASAMADLIGRWGTQTFVSNTTQKESHQINFGINNVIVGGLTKNNDDGANELSYMILHLVGKLKLSSPTVGLRWNKKTPEWFMNKAIRTNVETRGGIPLFENDEVVIPHYVNDGIPFEEAVEWGGLGCVYPCLPTRAEHYGAEGVAAINLAGMLHLALHDGIDINGKQTGLKTGNTSEFTSLEQVYDAFMQQERYFLNRIFRLGAVARDISGQYFRTPLLSVLGIEASMELGQDVMIPHPDYSLYGISDRAIIDVADSLMALKTLVFDEHKLSMSELIQAIESDFNGADGEKIRQMCLAAPKYGNAIEEVDLLAAKISRDSIANIRSYDNSPFHPYMVAREGLAWHYYGGLGVGALPNGRHALEALNDGSLSPMRGADTNGPTAVLASACNANFNDGCYAAVLNQKFTSTILSGEDCIDKLVAYTNTYMSEGGSHIQYNIVDSNQLKEAKKEPEEYSDLIVRIGGFSAYFVQLSSSIQDDVVNRSEFNL